MLTIYNTLTRQKEVFTPITPNQVRMYVCGMTVYDLCHLGHARVMVVFDVVNRWLRHEGYHVTYVRNITDIDDKIINRAAHNNESISTLTNRYIAAMHEDSAALGVLPPDFEPRATDYVAAMQKIISQLHDKNLAYQAPDGDVCYAVRAFAGYGKLSGKSLNDLQAGARIEVNSGKRDPFDFVLWKQKKEHDPAEAIWNSPWGPGRPGWHIECSAMSHELLGQHFDIHGGGEDLQFPHHENEIAQSEGAHGHRSVNYWMHNGFIKVDDEKMSKSLGNFFTIRDILMRYDAEVVRFFILRAHYRSPLNYSDAHLDDAKNSLTRLYTALHNSAKNTASSTDIATAACTKFSQGFSVAMNDDFNTPQAVTILFEVATELGRSNDAVYAQCLLHLANQLGLLKRKPQDFLQSPVGQADGLDDAAIKAQINARLAAKAARDFARADQIRAALLTQGIVLEDKAGGITQWRRE